MLHPHTSAILINYYLPKHVCRTGVRKTRSLYYLLSFLSYSPEQFMNTINPVRNKQNQCRPQERFLSFYRPKYRLDDSRIG